MRFVEQKDLLMIENDIHITRFPDNNKDFLKVQKLCREFNNATSDFEKTVLIRDMFQSVGERLILKPPFLIDTGNTVIGHNCFINSYCKFLDYGGIAIGNNVGFSTGVTLVAINHPCNPLTLDEWVDIKEPIIIQDDVWIGANVTILGNTMIGKGSIIGAGSVVTKNIPAGQVWAGNPARFIETVKEYKEKKAALKN